MVLKDLTEIVFIQGIELHTEINMVTNTETNTTNQDIMQLVQNQDAEMEDPVVEMVKLTPVQDLYLKTLPMVTQDTTITPTIHLQDFTELALLQEKPYEEK